MVLEASMIVLDNSEWMRNGDYTPTRMGAQNDAINLLFRIKTQSNPENTVGLMTLAGKSPEVLVTLTSDLGKILSALHSVKIAGAGDFMTGVQIAQLALKHRQNKNQRQRIIAFVGSPVQADEKAMVRLAKKMKKNNIAVDIINFGEESENTAKLEAFISNVNSGDNSHIVTIPPGPHILSEMLKSTPIAEGEDGIPAGFASGSGDNEFGIDGGMDPELELALRISLEEEKARQEAEAAKNKAAAAEGSSSKSKETDMAIDTGSGSHAEGDDSEDAELQAALAMSMGGVQTEDVDMSDLTEEEQISRAIELSMGDGSGDQEEANPDFMSSVLSSLPGVDPNDPRIKDALKNMSDKKDDKSDKKDGQ
ncbi:hypothetical protein BGW37DRAFT_468928 [Umbelopsis sp. PMI_123]|nr:hypothetical protein BGW37DRAFT_468928 [Umbelopsis sp. PMI_123]